MMIEILKIGSEYRKNNQDPRSNIENRKGASNLKPERPDVLQLWPADKGILLWFQVLQKKYERPGTEHNQAKT